MSVHIRTNIRKKEQHRVITHTHMGKRNRMFEPSQSTWYIKIKKIKPERMQQIMLMMWYVFNHIEPNVQPDIILIKR